MLSFSSSFATFTPDTQALTGVTDARPNTAGRELPAYRNSRPSTSRRPSTATQPLHEFTIEGANKIPLAILKFKSGATSSRNTPVFLGGQEVSGLVELNLRKPEDIKRVEITIKGLLNTAREDKVFFSHVETLWDKTQGDPRKPNHQGSGVYNGKLIGTYFWPFCFKLPVESTINEKLRKELGMNAIERLPPTLSPITSYQLSLDIRRRGLFNPSNSISTPFTFTPVTRPGSASEARNYAYLQKTLIPGPILDPCGWQTSKIIQISGTLFRQRKVSVTYTLSLATPLVYARGSVIPCHLTIQSHDTQALDLLANPLAPRVFLIIKPPIQGKTLQKHDIGLSKSYSSHSLSKAVWAPDSSVDRPDEEEKEFVAVRYLMGELNIPSACTPSFVLGDLSLEYCVEVHSPTPTGFQPESDNDQVLLSVPVGIATAYNKGSPRPRAYIAPNYTPTNANATSSTADTLRNNAYINSDVDEVVTPSTLLSNSAASSFSHLLLANGERQQQRRQVSNVPSLGDLRSGGRPGPGAVFDESEQLQREDDGVGFLSAASRSAAANGNTRGSRRVTRRFSVL